MPNHPPRLVTLIAPNLKGTQLVSLKQRPNGPCICGSGKKQKHCHGRTTKFWAPKAEPEAVPVAETAEPAVQYFFIELDHTHSKSSFLTLVRGDEPGHTIFLDKAMKSTSDNIMGNVHKIDVVLAKQLMQETETFGHIGFGLPNTASVRKAIGITLKHLTGLNPNYRKTPICRVP